MFQRLLSMGVPNSRLSRMILLEGAVTGALAALLGTLLGVVVAAELYALILGEAPRPPLVLDAWGLGKAIFSGLGVGVLSYYFASRADFAFRKGTLSRRDPKRRGPLLLVVLAIAFAWGLLDQRTGLVGAVCVHRRELCVVDRLPAQRVGLGVAVQLEGRARASAYVAAAAIAGRA